MGFKCHDCGTVIPGTNCAYELSYQMVKYIRWSTIYALLYVLTVGLEEQAWLLRSLQGTKLEHQSPFNGHGYVVCNGRNNCIDVTGRPFSAVTLCGREI